METPALPTLDRRIAEPVVSEPVGALPATALETLTRSELDVQITTARRYPRSLALFKSTALSLVRLDQATAASCYYTLPRRQRQEDGSFKVVMLPPGPTVRLAEIVAGAWGNVRSGARVIEVTATEVVAQGYAHDLQTNYAVVVETRRPIVDRNGRRYSDDMIVMTQNATCSIARRNALFDVIPRSYVNTLVDVAVKVAAGDVVTLAQSRKDVLAAFAKLGVPPTRVCEKLERAGVSDLDLDDVGLLRGLLTAIAEGETSVAVEFPPPEGEPGKTTTRAAALTETVRRRRGRDAAAGDRGHPGREPATTAPDTVPPPLPPDPDAGEKP